MLAAAKAVSYHRNTIQHTTLPCCEVNSNDEAEIFFGLGRKAEGEAGGRSICFLLLAVDTRASRKSLLTLCSSFIADAELELEGSYLYEAEL